MIGIPQSGEPRPRLLAAGDQAIRSIHQRCLPDLVVLWITGDPALAYAIETRSDTPIS